MPVVNYLNPDFTLQIANVLLRNPIMPASGCFGPELAGVIPTDTLGAVVTKTVFSHARAGNPADRVYDLNFGMLNSVGIPSLGIKYFQEHTLPRYQALGTKVIASIGGLTEDEYYQAIEELDPTGIDLLEINVSCPNLEHDGLPIACSADRVYRVISRIQSLTDIPLIAKLTPMVAEIGPIALAAEEAGSAAVTIANSVPGMSLNIQTRKSVLGNLTGGYTGPAIKPIVLKLVYDAYQKISIPIIACGGISSGADAVEFLIAGATGLQVGTATFTDPWSMHRIQNELTEFCIAHEITSVQQLIGSVNHD